MYDFMIFDSHKYHQNQDTEQLHHPQKSLLPLSSSSSHPNPAVGNRWFMLL